jgi:hypothetical protein
MRIVAAAARIRHEGCFRERRRESEKSRPEEHILPLPRLTRRSETKTMRLVRNTKKRPMSADAYAGFLKLWLTPASAPVPRTPEVDAYLAYANEREPLSKATRRAIGRPTDRAA